MKFEQGRLPFPWREPTTRSQEGLAKAIFAFSAIPSVANHIIACQPEHRERCGRQARKL
jgi:hypothetical protein